MYLTLSLSIAAALVCLCIAANASTFFNIIAAGLLRRNLSSLAKLAASVAFASLLSAPTMASAQGPQSIFPLLPPSVSTVPSNGDVNPYGVAFAPANLPAGPGLQAGDILVSNFNNSENLQGTGTTIVRVDRFGNVTTFYTSAVAQRGLTAAIGILSDGLVLVGNLPTADGTSATVQAGNLSVLNRVGQFLGTFGTNQSVNGPWGMAAYDTGNGVTGMAHVFVSNVLNGTISRFDISYNPSNIGANVVTIANGLNHRTDPAALVLGPTGLLYNATSDNLYFASSTDNSVYRIPGATKANSAVAPMLVFTDTTHLHGPLDLAFLPDGDVVVANSDGSNVDPNQPSELVEYTESGEFVNEMPVDPNNGGAFGLAIRNLGGEAFRLAAVDDNANRLNIWTAVAP